VEMEYLSISSLFRCSGQHSNSFFSETNKLHQSMDQEQFVHSQ